MYKRQHTLCITSQLPTEKMKDLTKGNTSLLILQFTIPMLIGNMFQQLYNVVDSIVVGNYLGEGALAAVGASFPTIFALFSLVWGITQGSAVVISQYFGAGKIKNVKEAIFTMYVIVVIASAILTVVGVAMAESIFRLIDLPEKLIPQASLYLKIIMGAVIIPFGMSATNGVLRGLGDSKTPLYFLMVSTVLNISFDLLFVILFEWGIKGVAFATVLAQAISFSVAMLYLYKKHTLLKGDMSEFKFKMDIFLKSIKIGLPTGLQQMFVSVGMVAVYQIVNQYDTAVIDAYSAAGRIDSFGVMPAMSFAHALTFFVGQNIGANRTDRLKKGLKSTILMTSAISIFFTILTIFFGRELMRMFSPNIEVIEVGYEYLVIVSSFYIIFSLMFSFNAVFRGVGDTIVPMFITLCSLWLVRIPISWYLSDKMGYTGIWWGIPLAWFAGLSLSISYYFFGRWKNKIVISERVQK